PPTSVIASRHGELLMPASGSILGNAVRRLEDPALLTGTGKYVDDLVEARTLHVAFVRSTVAHGNLRSVDVAETMSMPGVVAVSPDAPLLFPEHGSNVCFGSTFPEEGDADPLAGADVVADVTMVCQRLAGVPMETNGILAVPADGGLTCWVSHQAPHSIHAEY